ncbi:hypothetical protein D3C73_845310 [compost metagenome]
MLGRQAFERLVEQFVAERAPVHKGRLHVPLGSVTFADRLSVASVIKFSQAGLEQIRPSLKEIFVVQIHRPTLERMEERPRQWREDRRPAQQAEQRVDQAVFHVVHRRRILSQMRLDVELHRHLGIDPGQLQVQAQHLPG